jgi:hypothetical protein
MALVVTLGTRVLADTGDGGDQSFSASFDAPRTHTDAALDTGDRVGGVDDGTVTVGADPQVPSQSGEAELRTPAVVPEAPLGDTVERSVAGSGQQLGGADAQAHGPEHAAEVDASSTPVLRALEPRDDEGQGPSNLVASGAPPGRGPGDGGPSEGGDEARPGAGQPEPSEAQQAQPADAQAQAEHAREISKLDYAVRLYSWALQRPTVISGENRQLAPEQLFDSANADMSQTYGDLVRRDVAFLQLEEVIAEIDLMRDRAGGQLSEEQVTQLAELKALAEAAVRGVSAPQPVSAEPLSQAAEVNSWALQKPPPVRGVSDRNPYLAPEQQHGPEEQEYRDFVWRDVAVERLTQVVAELDPQVARLTQVVAELDPQGDPVGGQLPDEQATELAELRARAQQAIDLKARAQQAIDNAWPPQVEMTAVELDTQTPGYGRVKGEQVPKLPGTTAMPQMSPLPGTTATSHVPKLPGTTPMELADTVLHAQTTPPQQATRKLPENLEQALEAEMENIRYAATLALGVPALLRLAPVVWSAAAGLVRDGVSSWLRQPKPVLVRAPKAPPRAPTAPPR